ncbi:MAG TPA: tetratricopeptide repeat protein, partial [Firmicutes bacterium]|nr:tetratricopeptide repeat protein [Bacillota bacterium]
MLNLLKYGKFFGNNKKGGLRPAFFIEKQKAFIATIEVIFIMTAISCGPGALEYYEAKAVSYLEKKENTKAEKTAQQGIKKYPAAAEFYVVLGRSMLMRGENEKALDYFSKAMILDSLNAQAVMYTGAAYYNMNDVRAAEYLESSLKMDSGLKEAAVILGMHYLKNEKIKEGSDLLNKASSQYIKRGELDKAEELTMQVFHRNPSDPKMLINSEDMF